MLRVLELRGVPISNLPNEVSALFNLHYLGLRGTNVEQLPNNIQKLQSLQTLDLRRSRINRLPHGVTQLKQLRHLFVDCIEIESGGSTVVGCLPTLEGSWQWKNLQTLQGVGSNEELVHRLGDIKEIRTLGVFGGWKQAYGPQLCTSLSKMRNLRSLSLGMNTSEDDQLNFEMLNSLPPPLQKLGLWGTLFEGKMPTFIHSCAELIHVRLSKSHLIEDPLPSLGQLHKLVKLELNKDSYEGQQLHFRTGWFLNLKWLYLKHLTNLNNIVIEEDAMTSLYELYMWIVPKLKMVPNGIEFLTLLQKLTLGGMHEELMGKLREDEDNEERRRIRHIPFVTIR